jgi:hypothetical protein
MMWMRVRTLMQRDRTLIREFLSERGWKEITDHPPEYLFAKIVGWIKEPFMQTLTTEEALRIEGVLEEGETL